MTGCGGRGDDLLDGLGETHVQHLVGFVENQRFERGKITRALFDQVEQTARCRDDDIDAFLQRVDLMKLADTAEDRGDVEVEVTAEGLEPVRDLADQLARRASTSTRAPFLGAGRGSAARR